MTPGEFIYKLTFKPPFRQVKHLLLDWSQKRRHNQWRRWHERNRACRIHPSLELRDDTPVTLSNLRLGRATVIERDVTLWLGTDKRSSIELGERVYVGRNCYLGALEPLRIGDDSLIGAYSYIITANHAISNIAIPVHQQGYTTQPVTMGRDVWIGAHVVILPGVNIGDKAVVGAGAVVTKSIPPGEIWAGIPAKCIGRRDGGDSQP
jgi:acetyltransferase-like isoleucine patch superfamily enzyme